MPLPADWVKRLEDEKGFIRECHPDSWIVSLGFIRMPDGYALMWSGATEHYFWLRWDGTEGSINCDRWAVYRGAKADSVKFGPSPEI